jgi:hypothetical protein
VAGSPGPCLVAGVHPGHQPQHLGPLDVRRRPVLVDPHGHRSEQADGRRLLDHRAGQSALELPVAEQRDRRRVVQLGAAARQVALAPVDDGQDPQEQRVLGQAPDPGRDVDRPGDALDLASRTALDAGRVGGVPGHRDAPLHRRAPGLEEAPDLVAVHRLDRVRLELTSQGRELVARDPGGDDEVVAHMTALVRDQRPPGGRPGVGQQGLPPLPCLLRHAWVPGDGVDVEGGVVERPARLATAGSH